MKGRILGVTGPAGRLLKGLGPPLSSVQRASAVFLGVCFLGISAVMGVAGVAELVSPSLVSFITCGIYLALSAGALWIGVKTIHNAIVNRRSGQVRQGRR